jgi:hypothetical protein
MIKIIPTGKRFVYLFIYFLGGGRGFSLYDRFHEGKVNKVPHFLVLRTGL